MTMRMVSTIMAPTKVDINPYPNPNNFMGVSLQLHDLCLTTSIPNFHACTIGETNPTPLEPGIGLELVRVQWWWEVGDFFWLWPSQLLARPHIPRQFWLLFILIHHTKISISTTSILPICQVCNSSVNIEIVLCLAGPSLGLGVRDIYTKITFPTDCEFISFNLTSID